MTTPTHPPVDTLPGPVVVPYAGPHTSERRRPLNYLVLGAWCGALPLIVGTSVYVLWLVTRYRVLQALGLLTILGGILLFVIGAGCLLVDMRSGSSPPIPNEHRRWKRLGVALLLFSNFPVAGAIVASATYVESAMTVTVLNAGTATIDSFVMSWPDETVDFGSITAGGSSTRTVHLQGAGSVRFTATESGRKTVGTAVDYVDSDSRGNTTFVIKDGQITER